VKESWLGFIIVAASSIHGGSEQSLGTQGEAMVYHYTSAIIKPCGVHGFMIDGRTRRERAAHCISILCSPPLAWSPNLHQRLRGRARGAWGTGQGPNPRAGGSHLGESGRS
jgi:hypothetical protein